VAPVVPDRAGALDPHRRRHLRDRQPQPDPDAGAAGQLPGAGDHFAFTGRLLLSYLGVAVLHALWDGMHSIALLITLVLTGTRYQFALLERGYDPNPTGSQVDLFTVLSWGGLIVISLIGIAWLLAVRRHADREARTVLWRVPTYR
jgi:protease PrsW